MGGLTELEERVGEYFINIDVFRSWLFEYAYQKARFLMLQEQPDFYKQVANIFRYEYTQQLRDYLKGAIKVQECERYGDIKGKLKFVMPKRRTIHARIHLNFGLESERKGKT